MESSKKRPFTQHGSKPKRTKTVDQRYKKDYSIKFPVIIASKLSDSHAFCTACCLDFSVAHGGVNDCTKHMASSGHKQKAGVLSSTSKITTFMSTNSELGTTKAEVMFTNFIVEHNLPIAVSDHAGPLFRKMFPDSDIAKKYGSARTKTTAIIQMLGEEDDHAMTRILKEKPYSLATGK